jgi:hypothetical protein
MRIADCLPAMSKTYLQRIVTAIVKDDFPKGDEARMREQVASNGKELASPDRIRQALHLSKMTRPNRILAEGILTSLLDQQDNACLDDELFELVRVHEQAILEGAKDELAFKYTDQRSLEIYKTVLDVALRDDEISADEFALLNRLREHLGISRHETKLLEATLNHFPKVGNELHSHDEYKEAIKNLQL